MSDIQAGSQSDPIAPGGGTFEDRAAVTSWIDGQGRAWHIELPPQRIVLTSDDDVVDLPADSWARDIYVAPYADGFVIRFSTFQSELGFVVSGDQARPLLDHLRGRVASPAESPAAYDQGAAAKPLLWPKVSPLAVWALITSSLVFVPVIGFAAAVAAITLLVLHRRTVRHARAWAHSRALCLGACVFLVAGLLVSVLATWGVVHKFTAEPEPPFAVGRADPHPHADATVQDARLVKAGMLDDLPDRLANVNWALVCAALLAVLFSLTVHEASHAITAWWMGDDFARRLGRVTLSPLAHIDPFGTVLLPLILFLFSGWVFGWAKPVPVRMELTDNPHRAHILVSIAGPGSNLLLAAASLLLLLGIGCALSLFVPDATLMNYAIPDFRSTVTASGFAFAWVVGPVCTILQLSFLINVFLAFFNLIPIPPLDGSWVLEHLFPRTLGPVYERVRPYSIVLFLILIYSGVLTYLLIPALAVAFLGYRLLMVCTPFA